MIAFYAMGGLGNQLFQYAAARALAVRYQCELVVDPHWFEHTPANATRRSYELNNFSAPIRIATAREQARWRPFRSRLGRLFGTLQKVQVLKESGCKHKLTTLDVKIPAYMIGYWQSQRYFESIRDLLEQDLQPASPLTTDDLKVSQMIEQSTSVSIHVRRGDYVTKESANRYHGLCPIGYYNSAIEVLNKELHQPRFFVFSDDPEWASANLQNPAPTIYIRHNPPSRGFRDLILMATCQHHIIANSSFSWWGAWLSAKRSGIVIAPKRWTTSGETPPGLLPEQWVKL